MADPLHSLKVATALVLVEGKPTGTAYLLTHQHAATCAHVIRRVGLEGEVVLQFRWGTVSARVSKINPTADAALLTLDVATREEPLRRDATPVAEHGALWTAYGYPALTAPERGDSPAPILVRGAVRDPRAVDDWNVDALQLYCEDFAAGKGAMPQGMSGSPVIVRDRVVGHMKRVITAAEKSSADSQEVVSSRAELGIVYACPIEEAVALLPEPHRAPHLKAKRLLPPGAPYAPTWYIPRQEDKRAWSYAEANAPIWITGGWGMGASWFIAHLLGRISNTAKLNERPLTIITVDLRIIGLTPASTGDDFITAIAFAMAQRMGGNMDRFPEVGRLVWTLRLTYWMEEEILPRAADGIVLALEHFDALSGYSWERDVCYMLRRWVDQRPLLPLWSKLQPIIASTFSPATTTLGYGIGISPVATPPISLEDFTTAESEALVRAYGLSWSAADIEKELRPLVGGHPLLLVVAAHHAATTGASLSEVCEHARNADGPFMAQMQAWFANRGQNAADMDALRRLLQDPNARINDSDANRIRALGVLVEARRGVYSFRYKVQEVFLRKQLGIPGKRSS